MKKTYTKKQITEAIAYWTKQLKLMDESLVMTTYIGKDYVDDMEKVISVAMATDKKINVVDEDGIAVHYLESDQDRLYFTKNTRLENNDIRHSSNAALVGELNRGIAAERLDFPIYVDGRKVVDSDIKDNTLILFYDF